MPNQKNNSVVREVFTYLIALIAVISLLYAYQILFGPLVLACLIAYLLLPLVNWLSKISRIPRNTMAVMVYVSLIGLLIWASFYIVPTLSSQFSLLANELERLPAQAAGLEPFISNVFGVKVPITEIFAELQEDFTNLANKDQIFSILKVVSTNFVWAIVTVLTSFHILKDWEILREWIFKQVPKEQETEVRQLHQEIKVVWRTYLRGQLIVLSFIGVLSGLGAAAIGLPGAFVLGLIAGGLAIVPNVGPAVATAMAALVAYTQGSNSLSLSNLGVAALTVLIFSIIQLIEGMWLTPRVMGRRLNIHPAIILIVVVGTLFTLGAVMALIIVPLMVSLTLVLRYWLYKRKGLKLWFEVPEN